MWYSLNNFAQIQSPSYKSYTKNIFVKKAPNTIYSKEEVCKFKL